MVTFDVDSLDFVDDEEARFGADSDFATRFDSVNSRLELEDLTNATVGYVPQNVGTDLIGGKFAETLSEGKVLADDGNVYELIQDAVDNASSWVKIGPGEYRELITVDTPGLTISGSGKRTKIFDDGYTHVIGVRAEDVTIRDVFVRSKTSNETPLGSGKGQIVTPQTASNLTIENVKCTGNDGWTIRATNGTGFSVINCNVNDASNGILIGEKGLVANCTAYNISDLEGVGIVGDDTTVVYNKIDGVGRDGIQTDNNDCLIGANRIDAPGSESGINIETGATDCIVYNNRISATTPISDSGTGTVLDANNTSG